ncbi:MAG: rod shape-determining protein RodA [Phycisphaerae bacterium]|nr:FtsW/RodA/SpoVE family cell cycle protein [Phycisphaerae bacterium]NUQ46258.1 rod shape-determining protein RodA [Phycisphaerae bacterium]
MGDVPDLETPQRPLPWSARLILLVALGLTGAGLAAIYASEKSPGATYAQTRRQLAFAAVGLLAAGAAAAVGHKALGRFAYPLFGLTLVLLAVLAVARDLPLDPVIPVRRNTTRWIVLGPLQFQVSDAAKIVFVLALAAYLRFRSNYRTIRGLMPPFLLTLAPTALILLEPDLGTSLLLMPVLFVMLFAAGARKRHLALFAVLGAAAAPAFYFSGLMDDYQRQRIDVLFRQNDPDPRWQMGPGFQLRQSKTAIGSGQLLGQDAEDAAFFRHNLLPEEHNDFIFAVIAHQFGFAGAAAVILAYVVLLTAGLAAASATHDPFSRLVAVGLSAMIGVQATVNIGMTMGLMPITGMTLPFISSGGSSLVTCFAAVGLLISVARHRPRMIAHKPFEFGDEEAKA